MSGTTTATTPTPNGLGILALNNGGFNPNAFIIVPYNPQVSAYNPIDPNLLAAAQANLSSEAANGIAGLENEGTYQMDDLFGLFGQWAAWSNTQATAVQQSLAQVASKSATACSGFLGCIF